MEKEILSVFLYNEKLKFNEIEKKLKTRSNKLAYHIKNLVKKGTLTKEGECYLLSQTSEHLIPYISDKTSPLPIILIHIGDDKKCFLHKRKKRPFLNMLSLPGGRLLTGESIEKGAKRIMKDKFKIEIEFQKINSVSLEHVAKDPPMLRHGRTSADANTHSFLLILTSATTKNNIELTSVTKNKQKIISSDYNLIKNHTEKVTKIETFLTYA